MAKSCQAPWLNLAQIYVGKLSRYDAELIMFALTFWESCAASLLRIAQGEHAKVVCAGHPHALGPPFSSSRHGHLTLA